MYDIPGYGYLCTVGLTRKVLLLARFPVLLSVTFGCCSPANHLQNPPIPMPLSVTCQVLTWSSVMSGSFSRCVMPVVPSMPILMKLNFRPGPSQQLCDLLAALRIPCLKVGWEGTVSLFSVVELEWAFCATPLPGLDM